MNIIYSPPIWHLYLSLILICGLSKMNTSDLKLCMHCWHLMLEDLCAVESYPFFWCLLENGGELLLACRRVVPGCSRLCAAGCGWGGWQSCPHAGSSRASSLDTNPEPFAFPLQQQWAVLLLSHLCFSLCCGFLPAKRFLGHGFWILFSPLPFFPSPRRAWCSSLAVAIEITEPYLYLCFSLPLQKGLLPLCNLAGWASCIIPHVPACPAPHRMSRLSCRLTSCVPLSWDEQLSHYIVLQAPSKSHWSVHSSGGHWTSKVALWHDWIRWSRRLFPALCP